MSATPAQKATARALMQYGFIWMLISGIWGIVVPQTPYPRLALTAHIQMMTQITTATVPGLMLHQPDFLSLSPRSLAIVKWGTFSATPMLLSQVANAYWGTNQFLKIAGREAGAPGGTELQEGIVAAAHIMPTLGALAAWGTMGWHLMKPLPGKQE